MTVIFIHTSQTLKVMISKVKKFYTASSSQFFTIWLSLRHELLFTLCILFISCSVVVVLSVILFLGVLFCISKIHTFSRLWEACLILLANFQNCLPFWGRWRGMIQLGDPMNQSIISIVLHQWYVCNWSLKSGFSHCCGGG